MMALVKVSVTYVKVSVTYVRVSVTYVKVSVTYVKVSVTYVKVSVSSIRNSSTTQNVKIHSSFSRHVRVMGADGGWLRQSYINAVTQVFYVKKNR